MNTKWATAWLLVCLALCCLAVVMAVSKGTSEGNFKNTLRFVPQTFESTLVENGYEANIIVNPYLTSTCTAENGYKISLAVGAPGMGIQFTENGYALNLASERPLLQVHDVAVTNVTTSSSTVYYGATIFINVTVANYAFNYETFNLATDANSTAIDTRSVTLTAKSSSTITIPWSTLSSAPGNYTISSYATPVPEEANTYDNTYVFGTVQVLQAGGGGCGRVPYCN
jgi:hypothetical protein